MSRAEATARRTVIAIVGAGECSRREADVAEEIGALVARRGGVVVTGGGTGVMEAASRGASDAGGLVIGILPGSDAGEANRHVAVSIPTRMGELRNGLVVSAADAVIAVGGEWGTLSEIALARKMGKRVIGWHTWELRRDEGPVDDLVRVETAEDAVREAFAGMGE